MVAKKILFCLIFFFVIAFAFKAFAIVQLGSPALSLSVTNYAPNEQLKGSVNIGLTNEPSSSLVEAVIYKGTRWYKDKRMTLIDFLNLGGASFTCNPANCSYLTVGDILTNSSLPAGKNFITINIITSSGQGLTTIEYLEFNITGASSTGYSPSSVFP